MKELHAESNQQNDIQKTDAILVNGEVFAFKADGLTRRVFANADKTKVVKVCFARGNYFNQEELNLFTQANDKKKAELADTKMLDNGYIEQEYLITLDMPEADELIKNLTPEQIAFARSCRGDVGFDKNGVLKCHDIEEYRKY
jgi:hypothetical protein